MHHKYEVIGFGFLAGVMVIGLPIALTVSEIIGGLLMLAGLVIGVPLLFYGQHLWWKQFRQWQRDIDQVLDDPRRGQAVEINKLR